MKKKKNHPEQPEEATTEKLTAREKKERRKQREQEQRELEKRLIAEGRIPVRTKYRPRSFVWNVFAVCMAFIFGIVFTIGAFIGGGYFVTSKYSLKDVLTAINVDYSQYITEEYAQKTLLELFQDVRSTEFTNLNSIAKYTPFLRTQLDAVNEQLASLGVIVDVDTLMQTNFGDIGTYFQEEVIANIQLGGVLGVKPDSSPLMINLCYGKEGVDYTVSDGKFVQIEGGKTPTTIHDLTEDAEGVLNGIELATALSVTPESSDLVISLCYGTEGVDYEIRDGKFVLLEGGKSPTTISDLTQNSTEIVNAIRLGDVLGVTPDSSPLMIALCYGKENADYTVSDGKFVQVEGGKAPTTIQNLTEDAEGVLNGIELATALSVTPESSELIISICYGTEGVDYEIVDGEFVTLEGGKAPATLKDLTDNSNEIINGIELGAALGVTPESDALTISICYGKEGVDYEIVDGKFVPIEGGNAPNTIGDLSENATGIINGIELGTAMSVTAESDAAIRYLAYGSEGIDYEIVNGEIVMLGDSKPNTIGDLSSGENSLIEGARICDLLDMETATSGFLLAVKDWTIGDLKQQSRIERLKIGQLFTVDETSSLFMQAISDWRVKDLTDQAKIDTLTIGDVLAVDETSPQILRSVADTQLGKFSDRLDTLRLSEILPEDELAENKILKNLADSTLNTLASDLQALTVQDMFGDDIYRYTENYVENARPVAYEGEVISRSYIGETQVVAGYFLIGADGYTLLADEDVVYDAEIAMANRAEGAVWATPYYTMIRHTVAPSYTYSVVDYENDGALVPLGKEVLEDADGEYYLDDENEKVYILEDGAGYYTLLGRVRTDLERVYSYSLDGVDVDESEVFYDAEGGVYYTEERAEAFLFYYSPAESSFDENTLYEESAIETRYATTDGAPLTRYLTGVWHMMLTDPDTGEEMFTPVLEMTDLMDTMTVNINRATLLDLYGYEILSSEPDVAIPESIKYDPDGGTNYVTNLNELTVSETINFVTYLVERIEMFG